MPKIKKIFTATLYAYVRPVNAGFVAKQARKHKVSLSFFMDAMIAAHRNRKPLVVKKPLTATEKMLAERRARQS